MQLWTRPKTQCAFTYHKDFHMVARMTLVESFKSPGNTSRLLLNSSKSKKYNPGGWDLPHPPGRPYSRCRMSFRWCPSPGGVPFFTPNSHPPHLIPLLTSWQTNHFHCQEKGKNDSCPLYPKPHSQGSQLKSHLADAHPPAVSSHEQNDDYVHLGKTLKKKTL